MWTGLLFIAYNGVVTKLYLNCRELIRRGIFTSGIFLAVIGTGIELIGFPVEEFAYVFFKADTSFDLLSIDNENDAGLILVSLYPFRLKYKHLSSQPFVQDVAVQPSICLPRYMETGSLFWEELLPTDDGIGF